VVAAVASGGGKAPAPLDKKTKVQQGNKAGKAGSTGTATVTAAAAGTMMQSSGKGSSNKKGAAQVVAGLPPKVAKAVQKEVGRAAHLEAEAAALEDKAATAAETLEAKASAKFFKAQQLKASALLMAQEARQRVAR